MTDAHDRPSAAVPQLFAAGLIVVAIFMGGATQRNAQALIFAGMGILMILFPPASPGWRWMLAALGLLAFSATGFLPGESFHPGHWRESVSEAGIPLSSTHSPQPRLTLEAWLLLAAGILWAGWIIAIPWDSNSRRHAARFFSAGILGLALCVLAQWHYGWQPPGWLSQEGHGPFPNRNHTAHVLALGGVVAVGCGADAFRCGFFRMVPWVLIACISLAALATTYSRGGILMLFAALAYWNVTAALARKSWKVLLLGLSGLCIAAAVLLVSGGPVAARFAGGQGSSVGFRIRIWEDTLALITDSPWLGTGLGNFAALFPFYRSASVIQSSIIHPENDWLWLISEAGWLAAFCAIALCAITLGGAFPNRRGTQRRLRGTALAASLAALLHSFVDVPAHRLGTWMAAAFVMVIARRDVLTLPSRTSALTWRVLGLSLVGLAAWWVNVRDHGKRAETQLMTGKFSSAEASATFAIHRAPLEWRPYFTRAMARASVGNMIEAVGDFRRARFLDPHLVLIPIEEGRFWAAREPALALAAWKEALHRADETEVRDRYAQIRRLAPDDAAFRAQLLELADGLPPLQMDWFLNAPEKEARAQIEALRPAAFQCEDRLRQAFERRAAHLEK